MIKFAQIMVGSVASIVLWYVLGPIIFYYAFGHTFKSDGFMVGSVVLIVLCYSKMIY
jgi:hypothetical protein